MGQTQIKMWSFCADRADKWKGFVKIMQFKVLR